MKETGRPMLRSSTDDGDAVAAKLEKLHQALRTGAPRARCLRRWSEFVRERDAHRCVDCHSPTHLSAHHICRKSFLATAQFETGNGITLCRECHRVVHQGFNRRPDLAQPVDAQGGEKLSLMERLYSILLDDAVARGMLRDDLYYLGDEVLGSFKIMQGYSPATFFPGTRLEQAYLILAETERNIGLAIAKANGFTLPDQPLLPGGMVLVFDGSGGLPTRQLVVRGYTPRST